MSTTPKKENLFGALSQDRNILDPGIITDLAIGDIRRFDAAEKEAGVVVNIFGTSKSHIYYDVVTTKGQMVVVAESTNFGTARLAPHDREFLKVVGATAKKLHQSSAAIQSLIAQQITAGESFAKVLQEQRDASGIMAPAQFNAYIVASLEDKMATVFRSTSKRIKENFANFYMEPESAVNVWSSGNDLQVTLHTSCMLDKYIRKRAYSFIGEEYDGELYIYGDAASKVATDSLCKKINAVLHTKENKLASSQSQNSYLSLGDKDSLHYDTEVTFHFPILALTKESGDKIVSSIQVSLESYTY